MTAQALPERRPTIRADQGQEWDEGGIEQSELVRILIVAAAVVASWLGLWRPGGLDWIALAGALVGGYPICREAAHAIRSRRMTMELSMSLAIVAALIIGEFLTGAVIVLFVLVAEVLEGLTVGRGRRALRHLVDLLPGSAVVRVDGRDREMAADQLTPGDVVIVKPGARIPVDGVVMSGHSFVDQATITGESYASREAAGRAGLRRDHQPVGHARGTRDRNRAPHRVRTHHRSRRKGGEVSRPHPEDGRPAGRLPRVLRPRAPPSSRSRSPAMRARRSRW